MKGNTITLRTSDIEDLYITKYLDGKTISGSIRGLINNSMKETVVGRLLLSIDSVKLDLLESINGEASNEEAKERFEFFQDLNNVLVDIENKEITEEEMQKLLNDIDDAKKNPNLEDVDCGLL